MSTETKEGGELMRDVQVPALALHLMAGVHSESNRITNDIIAAKDKQIRKLQDIVARQGDALHGFQYRNAPKWNEVEGLLIESAIHGRYITDVDPIV